MSPANLDAYYRAVRARAPQVLVGYTSCLFKLAKFIDENGLDAGTRPRLKAVIVTAETVTDADVELISRVFGAPTVNEYGMAETSIIAYSRERSDNLQLLWDSVLGRVDDDSLLYVTTLLSPLFPLIQYQTDDCVKVVESHRGSVLRMSHVQGRRRDVLSVVAVSGDVLDLSGILMVHALKSYPNVFGIQFEQLERDRVRICVLGDRRLDLPRMKEFFVTEMHRDAKPVDPAAVELVQIDEVVKSIAGKELLVRPRMDGNAPDP
ncbi:MAG: hypothetical protein V3U03_14125 [Myxococcota bacterium]